MTALLIRALRRRPAGVLARPSSVLVLTLVLAYASGLWTVYLHKVEGGHERNEPPFLLHWLRDSTLALPIIFMTIWLAVVLARRVIEREGERLSDGVASAVLACFVAIAASLATAMGNPAHSFLFGAHHGGPDLPLPLHLARDAMAVLAVNLPLALIVCTLLRTRAPWKAPHRSTWTLPTTLKGRMALRGALLVMLVAPLGLFAQNGAELAAAGAGPGAPCPTGAPIKTFDVTAIKVDIPLNRFGDHDPQGVMYAPTSEIDAIRAEERSQHVSIGLRRDPIQPLVIRANEGDCVQITFTNKTGSGEYGMHIDGLSYDAASSGDAIGTNVSSAVGNGETRTFRYWVPNEDTFEGAHYIRPGANNRDAVSHGLFGALAVEPPGSVYLNPDDATQQIDWGWEAIVKPASGKSFREYVNLFHEIGNETYDISTASGGKLPRVDPITTSYRPGTRAINYRSEPFMNRLNKQPDFEAFGYNSYVFGDPATPMPRAYLGDPSKIRIVHAGSEMFHVYHLHGGGIRWRQNPHADHTFAYDDTGLDKHPKTGESPSSRLDSQAFGPGESYDLQIEGGAGGVQQSAGDFLFHCHIAEHYVSGMWSFWRVFDTRQPDLAPLPDRAALPEAVTSAGLIGRTMPDGTTITKDNLDAWIRPQLPTPGVAASFKDGSVWDWTTDTSNPDAPLYLGEPEDTTPWPNLRTPADADYVSGHPTAEPGDTFDGNRRVLLFDPTNGRPAYPLLRPHIGQRSPFSPSGHSGAPYLGPNADQAPTPGGGPQPFAGRPDGLCPAGSHLRTYNIVSLQLPIKITQAGATDPEGKIFVLAQDVPDVLAGRKPAEPLAIRGNIGDCIAVTLTSRQTPTAEQPFPMTNIHIHHVQFDVQASDGVGTGMQFGQAVRPYQLEDVRLTAAAAAGDKALSLSSVAKLRPEEWIAVDEGTNDIEIRQIASIDAVASTVTLTEALDKAHATGAWAGDEFVQYRWYPDVVLDNIFFHDHVDGIHNWGHGLVGQFIVEPPGSQYLDPKTGQPVDSGTYVTIKTSSPLAPGLVDGSFRELALWTIDDNPITDSTLNLRSVPFADRNGDPSLRYSSFRWGDPNTPLPEAYLGDPFVVRTINVSANVDSLHIDGNRFSLEPRYLGDNGKDPSTLTDTLHYGISERYTAILDGGAGGAQHQPGDYLYFNGTGRRLRQGAWGIMRVLDKQSPGLLPLPGTSVPAGGGPLPAVTGGRPPAPQTGAADDPCPAGAPTRTFAISAVNVKNGVQGATKAFVPSAMAASVANGQTTPEPLVLHAAAGDCVKVDFTNAFPAAGPRASFHVGELLRTPNSSGVDVGFNPEQTVAPGQSRTYRFYADTVKIGSASISDFGDDSGKDGLYGMIDVAPSGSSFTDPVTGDPKDVGSQVDVHAPGGDYRDFSLIMSDADPIIGGSFMPYPNAVSGPALVNYTSNAGRPDDPAMFSSAAHGDPVTPILRAYPGDPVQVHAMVAPGSEQPHAFSLGGQSFWQDQNLLHSQQVQAKGVASWETQDDLIAGGAGGMARANGDFFYGDLRRPFTDAGMWGLMRVRPDASCPIKPLTGMDCIGRAPLFDLGFNPPKPAGNGGGQGPGNGEGNAGNGDGQGKGDNRGSIEVKGIQVSRLLMARRIRLGALRTRGLRMTLTVPKSTRVLRLRIFRQVGKGKRAAVAPVATVDLKVRRGGRITVIFRPSARLLRKLTAGTYQLSVNAGPTTRRLGADRAEGTVTFTR
jgi:manganese oxidase